MVGFFAATAPGRTVVVERGGTAWWIPFTTALIVAIVAAAASYYAAWRFKRADVNRENAFRAADLVDKAEQIASSSDGNFLSVIIRLLQEARIRAQPLGDRDLDDRIRAALIYANELDIRRETTAPDDIGFGKQSPTFEPASFPISLPQSSPVA